MSTINITEVKIYKLEDSTTKALASITIDDEFVVSGLRILDGQNGLWVAFPSKKDKNGEYKDICFPITKESRQHIQDRVLAKYNPFVNESAEQVYNEVNSKEKAIDVEDTQLPF